MNKILFKHMQYENHFEPWTVRSQPQHMDTSLRHYLLLNIKSIISFDIIYREVYNA